MNANIILCIVIITIILLIVLYPSNNTKEYFIQPDESVEQPAEFNVTEQINPEEIISFNDQNNEVPSIMSNMNTWYSNELIDHFDENGNPVYVEKNSDPIENYNLITDVPINTVEGYENEPISFIYDKFSGL